MNGGIPIYKNANQQIKSTIRYYYVPIKIS